MGYELWTSPKTGYRRRGTRLSEIRNLFENSITSRSILEPLKSCPLNSPAEEIFHILDNLDFDVAGVKEFEDSEIIGFVEKIKLKNGKVKDHYNIINRELLISDSTPLADIFKVLDKRESVFVLFGQDVQGIISRAELNKPPVRIYLFGLVSLLEMHFTYWIKQFYKDESWKKSLRDKRIQNANFLYQKRKEKNQDISLIDCLQLCDKRDIILSTNGIRGIFNIGDDKSFKLLIKDIEKLRNTLAHSQSDIYEGLTWERFVEVVEQIESLVNLSDKILEDKRIENSSLSFKNLWGD